MSCALLRGSFGRGRLTAGLEQQVARMERPRPQWITATVLTFQMDTLSH